ncbi:nucleotidyltransferase family protein [Rothia sp. BD8]|uniref:nucleotidyltransferase family protein n=1 Tax=Rothia sp. BD8 TaxID=2953894 RepID=UPI00383C7409
MHGLELGDRIRLAHAALQATADGVGADVLHIKGYASMPGLYRVDRVSTDADVLVRPEHLQRFLGALREQGWEVVAHFDSGSAFQHAMTLRHPWWGPADIHRHFPGILRDPSAAFELLWSSHERIPIAHLPCAVPQVLDQILVLLIHAGRDGVRGRHDVHHLMRILSAEDVAILRSRAQVLQCTLALATALGELESFRGHRDYLLWKVISQGGSRLQEWEARFRAARSLGDRLRLLRSMVHVNRDHLAMRLGHEPSEQELRAEAARRRRRALRELGAAAARRVRGVSAVARGWIGRRR